MTVRHPCRRTVLASGAAALAASLLPGPSRAAGAATRKIPSTGEAIPAVGLGTWITFNVGRDPVLLENATRVMAAFFEAGGRVIDSSPMYGTSQETLGHGLGVLGVPEGLFSADKVWTSDRDGGREQAEHSRAAWGVPGFSLMQVHNLRAWDAHLPVLHDMKAGGRIGYVGITTSEGRRHELFEEVMKTRPLDFVQVTFNPLDRAVERRILPLAMDRGVGVVVNRPFRQGWLTRRLAGKPLPGYAADLGAATWADLILKFILAHPAVTVAIPATTVPGHARQNVAAAAGPMPDARLCEAIARDVAAAV